MNELGRRKSDLKRGEEKKELWPQKTSRPLLFSFFLSFSASSECSGVMAVRAKTTKPYSSLGLLLPPQ